MWSFTLHVLIFQPTFYAYLYAILKPKKLFPHSQILCTPATNSPLPIPYVLSFISDIQFVVHGLSKFSFLCPLKIFTYDQLWFHNFKTWPNRIFQLQSKLTGTDHIMRYLPTIVSIETGSKDVWCSLPRCFSFCWYPVNTNKKSPGRKSVYF